MSSLTCCPCCGLLQRVPALPAGMRAACARCATPVRTPARKRRLRLGLAAAFAAAALLLLPIALSLPMLRVARLGHARESSILDGIVRLFASGEILVGTVVGLCSIVFPIGKLISLLYLCAAGRHLGSPHRALTYHVVEWTGRWGMLDVLLVALLVAALKLRGLVDVSLGPAAAAFATCVVFSLVATACFDSRLLWDPQTSAEGFEP